ncbi:uncharacterized protein DUF3419 [Krasilnikovia cinnamomea]|uniref:Uncharacterized protein DUF3419 n=1 Tax=Krasilnikovia cinnamomea TaxID=349313 RepID=A0A4Q7ZV83_9ACTN|nr:DUF3419 family protein [Krasilnikovia cinnamomea]RZU54519.1 uncharacterized protein DUF3419 [Krasilnikovia cinnamomea]
MTQLDAVPALGHPAQAPGWQPDQRAGGHKLIFGRMYEDSDVERTVLPRHGRILCVASAGDTALALAADGRQVTAVDANPAQIGYVRERMRGAPARPGSTERLLHHARRVLAGVGWRRTDLAAFCELADPAEQLAHWRMRFDNRRFRLVLGAALGPAGVRAGGFGAFTRAASGPARRFDLVVRQRLERGLGRHPNRTNPYVRGLLLGEAPPPAPAVDADRLELVYADVAAYLESVPAGSFTGFSLSNVLDAVGPAYAARLRAAVHRAGTPGAVAVWRSFGPGDGRPAEQKWAARDRAMLWGSLRVERIGTAA